MFEDFAPDSIEPLQHVLLGALDASRALWDLCLTTFPADLAAIRVLVSEGADVNYAGDNGWSPVHLAAMNNDVALLDVLARVGGRLDQQCNVRERPTRTEGPTHTHPLTHPQKPFSMGYPRARVHGG